MSSLPAHSSLDGTVIAPATTIAYSMSACRWPHISQNHTRCRSWRFTLVPTMQCGKGNDTPVASQVINHRSISRADGDWFRMPCASPFVSHSPASPYVSSTWGLPLAGPGIGSTPRLGGISLRISFISSG